MPGPDPPPLPFSLSEDAREGSRCRMQQREEASLTAQPVRYQDPKQPSM